MYLDINVDREPRGRITVELFPDVPVGAQRFADLARGVDGVGYSLAAKIDGVSPVSLAPPVCACQAHNLQAPAYHERQRRQAGLSVCHLQALLLSTDS